MRITENIDLRCPSGFYCKQGADMMVKVIKEYIKLEEGAE